MNNSFRKIIKNRTTSILLFLTYVLNLFDYYMTTSLVDTFGVGIEGNPFGVWMLSQRIAGLVKVVFVGLLLIVVGICLKHKPKCAYVSVILFAVYFILALYHLLIYFVLI